MPSTLPVDQAMNGTSLPTLMLPRKWSLGRRLDLPTLTLILPNGLRLDMVQTNLPVLSPLIMKSPQTVLRSCLVSTNTLQSSINGWFNGERNLLVQPLTLSNSIFLKTRNPLEPSSPKSAALEMYVLLVQKLFMVQHPMPPSDAGLFILGSQGLKKIIIPSRSPANYLGGSGCMSPGYASSTSWRWWRHSFIFLSGIPLCRWDSYA